MRFPLTVTYADGSARSFATPAALVQGYYYPPYCSGGGYLLGNYISRPISEIEKGLLLIINGQQDLRFDLEHEELGGLMTGMNGVLNSILGDPQAPEDG